MHTINNSTPYKDLFDIWVSEEAIRELFEVVALLNPCQFPLINVRLLPRE